MKLSYIFCFAIFIFISYYGVGMYKKISISKSLIVRTHPFRLDDKNKSKSILVLGDSTGVGVGADRPQDSVAGLLAEHFGSLYVENYAVSGAVVADLPSQIKQAKLQEYGLIVVQIGANDMVRFHNAHKTAITLGASLAVLPTAKKVFVMSVGNMGTATLFPWFIRPVYTWVNGKFHAEFAGVAAAHHATYVNLYKVPAVDLFSLRPDVYLSEDGFHPSSKGYGLWFEQLLASF